MKVKAECKSCGGTGVYVGMCERDGAGAVCINCGGSGCSEIEYIPFNGRKTRDDISRVYRPCNYVISPKVVNFKDIGEIDMTKEGVSYEEFLAGDIPSHINQLGCPMASNQGACHGINGFVDKCNDINGGYLHYIPGCKCENKMSCWDRFEKGNSNE